MSIQSGFSQFGSDDMIDLGDPTVTSNDHYDGHVDLINYEDEAAFEEINDNDNEGE